MGNSLSFWFRKELPSLAVCAIIGVWDDVKPPFLARFNFYVKVNDIYTCVSCFRCGNIKWTTEDSHIIILNRQKDFQHPLKSDIQRALLTNEWIPGKIVLKIQPECDSSRLGEIEKTGAYVNRRFSRVEDVLFEDPYAPNKASTMENRLVLLDEAPDIQQQQQLSGVNKVEEGLESEKQLRNSMVLKNEIDERLTRIRKMKEDLGEKLNAIKADISAIEANHSSIKANISAIKPVISAD